MCDISTRNAAVPIPHSFCCLIKKIESNSGQHPRKKTETEIIIVPNFSICYLRNYSKFLQISHYSKYTKISVSSKYFERGMPSPKSN